MNIPDFKRVTREYLTQKSFYYVIEYFEGNVFIKISSWYVYAMYVYTCHM